MGIAQDIVQTSFRSDHQRATLNLIYTYGWVMEKIKMHCAAEDITPQQFNILRILRGSHPKPLSTLTIRERMLDKMSDTSRIVDRLVTKGLAKKSTSKEDKRLVDITITDKGKKLLDKMDIREYDIDNILGQLTKKEAVQLSNLLDKIRSGQDE